MGLWCAEAGRKVLNGPRSIKVRDVGPRVGKRQRETSDGPCSLVQQDDLREARFDGFAKGRENEGGEDLT